MTGAPNLHINMWVSPETETEFQKFKFPGMPEELERMRLQVYSELRYQGFEASKAAAIKWRDETEAWNSRIDTTNPVQELRKNNHAMWMVAKMHYLQMEIYSEWAKHYKNIGNSKREADMLEAIESSKNDLDDIIFQQGFNMEDLLSR